MRAVAYLRKDPVLVIAGLLAGFSMFLVPPDAGYLAYLDFKVLICLFSLMLAVELLQAARLFTAAAAKLINKTSGLRRLTLVLTALSFFSSMILTNDVALLTFVPLTLVICRIIDDRQASIRIVVLQTIAANVGSMMTPVGNPQNLYLFTHGQLVWPAFWAAVWPVGLVGAGLLLVCILLAPDLAVTAHIKPEPVSRDRNLLLSLILFPAAVACVFGLISEWLLLGLALFLLLIWQRRVLLRADYALLLTFVFFFLFIGNISRLPEIKAIAGAWLGSRRQVILAGSLLSQVISNVPAAILLSGFTDRWDALLRGVNIGGCGTLIASLASVISWRLFSRQADQAQDRRRFLLIFSAYNLLFLAILLTIGLIVPLS